MSKDTLKSLHTMLCEELVKRLASGEETPPAVLNVIRQFLKDNHIDSVAEDGSAISNLIAGLPSDFKEKFTKKQAS